MPGRVGFSPALSRRALLAGGCALGLAACATAPPPAMVTRRRDFGLLQDDGSRVVLPPGHETGGPWPTVVFLPATDGTAPDLYRYYAEAHATRGGFVALLPPGSSSSADYASGERFAATVDEWRDRVAAMVAAQSGRFGLDPERVGLAGFSLGGDLAWALSLASPAAYCGAIVMGSRCGWRDGDGLSVLAFRGYRFALLRGADESDARAGGMEAARRLLDTTGIANLFDEMPGEHVRAPPPLFMQAADFVLGSGAVAGLTADRWRGTGST
ncbi:dienelactone hydrolase family protein [Zavarzinia aquatilis]|nr:dienelactone hydrolase family protein [Zavarzinia aquatilis]